jgi:hypothetical protein
VSGVHSIRSPFDFDILLRACYNSSPFPNIMLNERGSDLANRFFEKFPQSSFVHLTYAVFLFECCKDIKGMLLQGKLAKRQDTLPDSKYQINCLIQYGHDLIEEETGGKKEIISLLESCQKHMKEARYIVARFFLNLEKTRETDTPETLSMMRTL